MNSTIFYIKKFIPNSIKYPFYYLLKAPQRGFSSNSVYRDLKGIGVYIWYSLFPFKTLKPITICTGIYNRSDNYLNYLLQSINECNNKDLITLSVFDCNSNDVENLELEIRKLWNGKLIFNSENINFSRSYTFNKAVKQSETELIFICDADLSLPKNIVTYCNFFVGSKRVWYPIFFFLYKNKPKTVSKVTGEWELYGSKGMLACLKKDWDLIGGLNETYVNWGNEDTELWERFHKSQFTIVRNKTKIFHHWHQTHNPKYEFMNKG